MFRSKLASLFWNYKLHFKINGFNKLVNAHFGGPILLNSICTAI